THNVVIRRDPRISANNADLIAQYAFANEILARKAQIDAARSRAQSLLERHTLSAQATTQLRAAVLGVESAEDPDDSVGKPSHDFTSLQYLNRAFSGLFDAVESADAAPTSDMRVAYTKLERTLDATLAKLNTLSH